MCYDYKVIHIRNKEKKKMTNQTKPKPKQKGKSYPGDKAVLAVLWEIPVPFSPDRR